MLVEHTETLLVVSPFQVKQHITNMQMEIWETVAADEQYLLHSVVANTCSCPIQLTNWNLMRTVS